MTKKTIVFFGLAVLLLAYLLFVLIGCAKPPTQELALAEKAIAEAKQKEADLYAQDILAKAEDSLKKAKDFAAGKKYKEAKQAAEEAIPLAQQAITLAEQNKAKLMAEVEQMSSDVEKALNDFKALVEKLLKKMGPREQKDVQDMVAQWEKDRVGIQEMIQAKKIREAYDPLKKLKEEIAAKHVKYAVTPEQRKGIK